MDVDVWLVCGVTAIVASVLARRSRRAMVVGRVAVGVLMLVGGAVVNAAYLWFGLRPRARRPPADARACRAAHLRRASAQLVSQLISDIDRR